MRIADRKRPRSESPLFRASLVTTFSFLLAPFVGGWVSCASPEAIAEDLDPDRPEVVVLVHGMGRTSVSMLTMQLVLEREGYEVVNWGYSSTCCSLSELGRSLAVVLGEIAAENPEKIHFVGHSLGNIIVRWVLHHEPPEQPGRVVMLAPPNQGSQMADRYAEWLGWLLEPLPDLTTDQESMAKKLPPVEDRDLGIIAGRFDRKVAVEETRQETEDDHRVVGAAHTFIMNRPEVHRLTLKFLEHGEFSED